MGSRGSGRRPKARSSSTSRPSPKRRASPARGRLSRSSSLCSPMPCKASQCSRPGPSSQTGAACRARRVAARSVHCGGGSTRERIAAPCAVAAQAVCTQVAERAQRRADRLAQALQAAEVAQARLHLEQHRVGRGARLQRRLQGDAGRERQRRMRHRQQRQGIAVRVGLAEDDLRRQRQGGRALQPRLDAERARRGIGADDAMRLEQGDRPLRPALVAARRQGRGERLEREQGQMQGDPEHGEADGMRRRGSRGNSEQRTGTARTLRRN